MKDTIKKLPKWFNGDVYAEAEQWWQDVYEELFDQKKEELLDSGDYYEEKED